LKYKNQKPAITRAIRISKPSKRVYVSVDPPRAKQHVPEGGKAGAVGPQLVPAVAPATTKTQGNISPGGKTLPRAQGLLGDKHDLSQFSFMQGTFIISTSKGPVPDATAVDLNLGGELLCHVYQQLRPLVAIALRSLRPASPGAAKQAFDPCPRFAGALAHGLEKKVVLAPFAPLRSKGATGPKQPFDQRSLEQGCANQESPPRGDGPPRGAPRSGGI